MAQKRKERLDCIDAEHLERTVASEGWQLIRQRIERTVGVKLLELRRPLDPVQTATVRGVIEGLELALGMPAILLKEAAANRGAKESDASDLG